ncbi:LPS-assembly protein LptD [bacterium]|nr:MAG: LPS-assembly protein LptD [bacterium]
MNRCFVLLSIFLFFHALPAGADDGRIQIQADSMITLPDGIIEAEGNVIVKGEGLTVRADRIRYESEESMVYLSGNVVVQEDAGSQFKSDSLELNVDTLLGGAVMGEVLLEPTGYRITGDNIRRVGPDSYQVSKGMFTSCPGDCPEWSVTSSRIDVTEDGYLTAKNAAFRLANIPVFYTPYLFYPAKVTRQTGLLIPELGYKSSTGWEFTLPLFITLGKSADLTVAVSAFSRDETALDGEFRYRLPYGGGGDWGGFIIGDKGGDDVDRWVYSLTHSMALTRDLWLRGKWYDAGNPDTPVDFGRTYFQRNPGVVNRNLTTEYNASGVSLWLGLSDLVPDGARAQTIQTLNRSEAGGVFGPYYLGPTGGEIALEYTGFESDGERFLFTPEVSLNWNGPGALAGGFRGEWSGSADVDGSVKDSFTVLSLEEKLALLRVYPWGRHHMDFSLIAAGSSEFLFSDSIPRDGRDAGRESRLVAGFARSRLTAGTLEWDIWGGAWKDWDLEKSMGWVHTTFKKGPWYLSGSLNRDAEYGLVLPVFPTADTIRKGWSVGAGYNKGRTAFRVRQEEDKDLPSILTGSYKIPIWSFDLSGTAQYDLEAEEVSDDTITLAYRSTCWTVGVSRIRNRSGVDWKFDVELLY